MAKVDLLAPDLYPDGWDNGRVAELARKVAVNPKRGDMTPMEKVIGELGYKLSKTLPAYRIAMRCAEERKQEIENLTGKPFKGLKKYTDRT